MSWYVFPNYIYSITKYEMFGNSLSKENKNNFLSKILAPSPVLWYPFFPQLLLLQGLDI